MDNFLKIDNASALNIADIPDLKWAAFTEKIITHVNEGASISAFFVCKDSEAGKQDKHIIAVVQKHSPSTLCIARSQIVSSEFPSLTPYIPELHLFEREIYEQYGIEPKGHPWLKGVRRPSTDSEFRIPNSEFYKIDGDSIHEVAVGPVHAGVIEPGHFRFQCSGETVHHLEISLGYQHRDIENLMLNAGNKAIHYAETASGDSTIAHAIAYCRLQEALTQTTPSPRAEAIRAIALELERVANHVGDLGALAGDVAYLPTASYCGRIRGEYLNMTAEICGNRFGRNLIRPGGVSCDISTEKADKLLSWIDRVYKDTVNALNLMFDAPTVLDRFENTGTVSKADAKAIGMVGMAARASGLYRDIRTELPTGHYKAQPAVAAIEKDGDVLARAKVRYTEIKESIAFLRAALKSIPTGELIVKPKNAPHPNQIAIALEEGWRGGICHIQITDKNGRTIQNKIIDPSFHNWFGLALALREQEISDFPICNKSFNLSYCGHDL